VPAPICKQETILKIVFYIVIVFYFDDHLDKKVYIVPYESAVFAFMGMGGKCSYANKIIKSAFVQCVVVNPHSLKV